MNAAGRIFALLALLSVSFPQASAGGLGLLSHFGKTEAPQPVLFRHGSIHSAWETAQKSGKPVLIYVSSDNCFYCQKMVKTTLANPEIRTVLTRSSEPVRINASQSPELAKQLGVQAFPTTLVVSANNQLLAKVRGFADEKAFAAQIWPALRASTPPQPITAKLPPSSQIKPASAQLAQPALTR